MTANSAVISRKFRISDFRWRIHSSNNPQSAIRNPQSVARLKSLDGVVVGLLLLAGILLLTNLDSGCLWQDEAETAVLARNTLRVGYPTAFDGRSLIDEPLGYGPNFAWIYSPWLTFYVLAAVFAVAGQSTWVARLPFALAGLLSIYLTWRLARRLTQDVRIQRLSVALLTFSVPFLLHMRQCRYYALTTLGLLASCLACLAFLERPSAARAAIVGLVLSLLFHTNFGTFVPAAAAIAARQIFWVDRPQRRWLLVIWVLVLALTIPWAVMSYRPGFHGTFSADRLWHHLQYYVRVTNKYLAPLALMVGVSSLLWMLKRVPSRAHPWRGLQPAGRWLLVLMIAAQAIFLIVVPNQRHLRYLIPTLPLLAIAQASWLVAWSRRRPLVGGTLIGLALLTNVLQSVPWRLPLVPFVHELTHRYTGPMDGVVRYLQRHARPDEVVKIPYDDRTLIFYTDLSVERPSAFLRESDPDWVVLRRDWIPEEFFSGAYYQRIQASYDRIELDAPDVRWQNREDPGSHQYRTVQGAPPVVIYRKRERVSREGVRGE